MPFTVSLVGDKAVVGKLEAFTGKLKAELKKAVQTLALMLQGKVQTGKLQGQVLRHITGNLSASIAQEVTEDETSVLGRVFSNGTVKYARIHEFGFSGAEAVAAHQRRQTMVFGRAIDPIIVQVAAFTRNMNMPARSFLRSTLVENRETIERQLTECVARAWGASP